MFHAALPAYATFDPATLPAPDRRLEVVPSQPLPEPQLSGQVPHHPFIQSPPISPPQSDSRPRTPLPTVKLPESPPMTPAQHASLRTATGRAGSSPISQGEGRLSEVVLLSGHVLPVRPPFALAAQRNLISLSRTINHARGTRWYPGCSPRAVATRPAASGTSQRLATRPGWSRSTSHAITRARRQLRLLPLWPGTCVDLLAGDAMGKLTRDWVAAVGQPARDRQRGRHRADLDVRSPCVKFQIKIGVNLRNTGPLATFASGSRCTSA